MNALAQQYRDSLERVCEGTIAEHAASVDGDGTFPTESIDALRRAGFLGAMSALEVGGLALGLRSTAAILRRIAEECGSTAMVLCMHYCGVAVLEKHAPSEIRRAAATGEHLTTLAFSEAGSRSHFWAPDSTASLRNGDIVLNARKSWITSAGHATTYVWSSKPIDADGLSTLWLVPAKTEGVSVQGPFEGFGLRGNDSCPVVADNVRIPRSAMLGADGDGFQIMMNTVLPVFNVLNGVCSLGFMDAAVKRTARHAGQTYHSDSQSSLAHLPTIRSYIARMQIKTDMVAALLDHTLSALEAAASDATLRVLESKAAAAESAGDVLDTAMRVCGGAAFRKEVSLERYFRDAKAAGIMAPTTDVLYDFIGKSVCLMPLF